MILMFVIMLMVLMLTIKIIVIMIMVIIKPTKNAANRRPKQPPTKSNNKKNRQKKTTWVSLKKMTIALFLFPKLSPPRGVQPTRILAGAEPITSERGSPEPPCWKHGLSVATNSPPPNNSSQLADRKSVLQNYP